GRTRSWSGSWRPGSTPGDGRPRADCSTRPACPTDTTDTAPPRSGGGHGGPMRWLLFVPRRLRTAALLCGAVAVGCQAPGPPIPTHPARPAVAGTSPRSPDPSADLAPNPVRP